MLFSHARNKTRQRQYGWLYSLVFTGRISTMAILLLFMSFLIQPFHKAFASEPIVESLPEPPPIAALDVELQVDRPPIPEESPPPDVENQNEIPQSVTETEDFVVTEVEPLVTESDTSVTSEEPTAAEIGDDSSGEVVSPGDSLSASDPETEFVQDGDSDFFEETKDADALSDDTPQEEIAVASSSVVETVIQAQYLVTEENYYQFSKQSCIAVGEGAFHCTAKSENEIDSQSVVYSETGGSGNMEIFLKTTKGKVKQITDNSFDDTSPFYDAESMRIVWQRLIDGRQQIVLFDIQDEKESQLTFSRSNNMEPKVSGAGIVWQAWDENDWEIMYFDGTYTDQLTQNDGHDVAPVIKDNYILWSVLGGDEQQARVYSLDTKETISIIGHEGGSIENPRFVLVYDTKFDNGDVVTQGFDPETGLSKPIASQPAQEPVDIPNTDTTGETRALIQNKSAQKEEKDFSQINSDPDPNEGLATSSSPGTLDLTSSDTPVADRDYSNPPFELTDYDLVLPITDTSASSTQ